MSKITMTNISSGRVVVSLPDNNRFRQELVPGRTVPIPQEVYDDLLFDAGFLGLVRDGYLRINGVENADEVEESKISTSKTAEEIGALLESKDITAFAKFIKTAAPAEKESAANYVIEHNITVPGIVNLIQQYCDVDVIKAITLRHEATSV